MDTAAQQLSSTSRGHDLLKSFVRLSLNPWSLFLGLLLINAIARPYSDLTHDARLYAVQVLDRANLGLYSDDLYLRFGSQDKFSLFSQAMSPLAQRFGIRPTFFVAYLASTALLLFSAQRFVSTMVRRKSVAALSLVYLAVNPVTFGGLGVFHVNEAFLTPRLAAIAFVFLALEQLARRRILLSLLLLAPALVIHPVMAFSGLLVWCYFTLTTFLTTRQVGVIAAGGIATVAALMMYEPLGNVIFGGMDATWKRSVHASNYYAIPHKWVLLDWIRIATAFAITLSARFTLRLTTPVTRLLDAISVVAVLGIVGGMIAPFLPYALPFQGQPYRALWLLQFIQLPMGVALLRYAWSQGTPQARSWAVLIGSSFALGAMTLIQILSSLGMLLVARFRQILTHESGGKLSTGVRVLITAAILATIAPLISPVITSWDKVRGMPSPLDLLRFIPPALGPLYTLVGCTLLLTWIYLRTGGDRRFQITALIGFIAVQAAFFFAPQLSIWRHGFAKHEGKVAELRTFLDERFNSADRLPTIYWPQAGLDDIWINLSSKCYFTKHQTAGNMFNRGTAIEGQRRAELVSSFELAEFKRRKLARRKHDWRVRSMLDLFGTDIDAQPSWQDLDRLCQEDVDILVIRHDFESLHSIKLGEMFVYECDKIRETVRQKAANESNTETIPVSSNESGT